MLGPVSEPTGPQRCSEAWSSDDLSAFGTAPSAEFWVALEQPGPWGAKAATQSRLDATLGAELDRWCLDRGGRLALIRPSGGQRAAADRLPRRLLVAGGLTTSGWLGAIDLDDPADAPSVLAAVEPFLAGTGVPAPLSESPSVIAVCTNAKRDQCCARLGLPLAADLSAAFPGRVWEASHLGGHRFASTAIVWPTGQMVGRLDSAVAAEALAASDDGLLWPGGDRHDRGRTAIGPAANVAEAHVRAQIGAHRVGDLTTTVTDDIATVTHHDGRTWRLRVTRESVGQRIESCLKLPVEAHVWRVTDVTG